MQTRSSGDAAGNTLTGGSGNDTLRGGRGKDTLQGGAGADTASYAERGAADALTVTLDGAANDGVGGENDAIGTDVENILGGARGDTLTGNDGPNTIEGGGGNDTITGLGGVDTLRGGAGDDFLKALDGTGETVDCGDGTGDRSERDAADTLTGCEVNAADADGDGFVGGTGPGTDCNDGNPNIRPGAPETRRTASTRTATGRRGRLRPRQGRADPAGRLQRRRPEHQARRDRDPRQQGGRELRQPHAGLPGHRRHDQHRLRPGRLPDADRQGRRPERPCRHEGADDLQEAEGQSLPASVPVQPRTPRHHEEHALSDAHQVVQEAQARRQGEDRVRATAPLHRRQPVHTRRRAPDAASSASARRESLARCHVSP